MFLNHSPYSVGLDISERALRIVQLKKTSGKIKLVSWAELKSEPGLFKDNQFTNTKQAVEQFKTLAKKIEGQKIRTHYCVACLPEQKTFIKVIDLPAVKAKDITADIIEESKKHIPYPLEQAYLDWQYINEKDTSRAIIGLCPKDIVENYQTVLNQAGLQPEILEIEAMSVCRSLFPLNKKIEEPVMILDLGATRTGLVIYEENYIPFSLSLKISSENLTDCLAKELELTPEQAEEAKVKIGLNPDKANGGVLKILTKTLEELAQEIREAKYFYYEHFAQKETIKKIYLTGGGANLKGLGPFIQNLTKLETIVGDPLINLTIGKIEITEKQSQSFATAIGLALRKYQ